MDANGLDQVQNLKWEYSPFSIWLLHNKIHLISPGCFRPSIALQVQNRDLEYQSFIHSFNMDIAYTLTEFNVC